MNIWCARCKEEFPVADNPNGSIRMGWLYPLKRFKKKIKNHFQVKNQTGDYLCGNCYFDLTD